MNTVPRSQKTPYSMTAFLNRLGAILYLALKTIFHTISITVFGTTSTCKQNPSCSRYLVQQVREHGTIRGLWRGGKRILTCTHA